LEIRQKCQVAYVDEQGASVLKHKKEAYREWKQRHITWEDLSKYGGIKP